MPQIFPIDPLGSWGLLVLRIVVGAIFIYHGLPKPRMAKTATQAMGMPQMAGAFAVLGVVESLSGALLILGYFIQYASLALIVVMLGALWSKIFKWRVPFTAQDKAGWEFDLLLLAASFLIFTTGGGSLGIGI